MLIRLGYACISETLSVTSSSTYTYTRFCNDQDYNKLDSIIRSNLRDLIEILRYNKKNSIHFYRLSSGLIPLATKEEVKIDYSLYKDYYKEIARLSKNMRIDFHPSQFCVLNSTRKEVIDNSILELKYNYDLLEYMKVKEKVLVLHIGSSVFGKKKAIERFINNYKKLPVNIRKSIVIENDDKVFDIGDCLCINKIINIPIVFDYHHYVCNPGRLDLYSHIEDIFKTWGNMRPKVHFSSPKSKIKKEFRTHNDYINSDSFIDFVEKIKDCGYDLDIMIEAKKKDEAMFRLIRELKYKTNYKFIDDTSFVV